MPRITLRQIAEEAGCTRATVCYALQNASNISTPVKNRIRAIAERMGWRPNAELARVMALTRGATMTHLLCNLAVIIQKSWRDLEADPIPMRQFLGARERLEQLGFSANVFNLHENPLTAKRMKSIFRSRNILGAVYIAHVGSPFSRETLSAGSEIANSVVAVRYPKVGYHVAITDFLANGLIAMEALAEAGYRKVGVILPRGVDEPLDWGFKSGLIGGHQKYFGNRELPFFYTKSSDFRLLPEDKEPVQNWLKVHKCDALLTTDTMHLTEYLGGKSRLQPSVFSLCYHEGTSECEGGVNQRYEMAGAAGVDLVVAQLHRGEAGLPAWQKSVQIAGEWIWKRKQGKSAD